MQLFADGVIIMTAAEAHDICEYVARAQRKGVHPAQRQETAFDALRVLARWRNRQSIREGV